MGGNLSGLCSLNMPLMIVPSNIPTFYQMPQGPLFCTCNIHHLSLFARRDAMLI
tara:strand:- start:880 stop:1041 length:162 start_codon:yes stop_codon:yes gene_type:complete